MEIDNDNDSMEQVNLEDYNSDDFNECLSDNEPPPTTEEVPPSFNTEPYHPSPSLKVTIKMEKEDDDYEEDRRRICNQRHAERHQRVLERIQEDNGESHDYSNNDLRNIINIGRDARTVIISNRHEREEIESYSPSSNYRLTPGYSAPARKKPNTRSHNSKAGPSRPPNPQYMKAEITQHRFEQSYQRRCP